MPMSCSSQNALSADLHHQHPRGPLYSGSTVYRSPELRHGTHVDGFHRGRGALGDGANEHLEAISKDQRKKSMVVLSLVIT